jgi:hypothetical protein
VNEETPLGPAATTIPEVVVVGNLTIDDVVLADGSTLMATLGRHSLWRAGRAGRQAW